MDSLRRDRTSDSLEKGVREPISRKSIMAKKENNWIPNLGAKGWGITFVCILFYLFYGFWNGASNTLFGIYEGMFGWTQAQIAGVISAGGWVSLIAIVVFGALGKKVGAKTTSVIGLVGTFISCAIIALATNFAMFSVGVILFFVTMVAYGVIGVGTLGSAWFPHKKGVFMGFATMGLTICSATINPIILGFAGGPGISAFWWFVGVLALVIAVIVLAFVKNNPEEAGAYPDNDRSITSEQLDAEFKAAQEYKKNSPWTVGRVLKTPQTWFIGIGWGLPMLVGAGSIAILVPTLIANGHDPLFGVVLLSSMWPVGLLGHYLIGVIDQYIGTKKTTFVVNAVVLIACLMLWLGGGATVPAAVAAGLLMFGLSGCANVCMSMTTTVFGRQDFETAWAPIQVIYNIFNYAGVTVMTLFGVALGMSHGMAGGVVLCALAFIPIALCSSKQIGSQLSAEKAEA